LVLALCWVPVPRERVQQERGELGDFAAYRETIPGAGVSFDMVPIPAGEFQIGSPKGEAGRQDDEGPQRRVRVDAFWMAKHEVTWGEFELWMLDLDVQRRQAEKRAPHANDALADAVTRPTRPYADMSFGMGQDGYPAISMTQLAAKYYCEWLSAKTGRYYRLPTEAEWEYACRAGSTTAFSFGAGVEDLGEHAWFAGNSDEKYHKVGQKKPNAWGLFDMHGNVAEWVLDHYHKDAYARLAGDQPIVAPFLPPSAPYPQVVRGGSWQDEPAALRSAARRGSHADWKMQDPQIPQSVWYLTDAQFVGFRVVRPLAEPTAEEKARLMALTAEQRERIEKQKR
jgi:formylglycine-generating enzyme required for sulfatase activity